MIKASYRDSSTFVSLELFRSNRADGPWQYYRSTPPISTRAIIRAFHDEKAAFRSTPEGFFPICDTSTWPIKAPTPSRDLLDETLEDLGAEESSGTSSEEELVPATSARASCRRLRRTRVPPCRFADEFDGVEKHIPPADSVAGRTRSRIAGAPTDSSSSEESLTENDLAAEPSIVHPAPPDPPTVGGISAPAPEASHATTPAVRFGANFSLFFKSGCTFHDRAFDTGKIRHSKTCHKEMSPCGTPTENGHSFRSSNCRWCFCHGPGRRLP